ncbi:hypothetical protein [Fulvivirga lutimaris]|uniref:hypothetical protein n=1 Tax=Fulvivirga lutimaris TaxID=1819566 RepID=UPI0012BD362B|nr:hypothetical protein [Fulvivirga lutimaris]MTI38512.1 hypothetical protein [Fulvivirga lutimaris]
MFSENEIATIIEIPEVLDEVIKLRKEFIETEANFLEISEHDFLSLIMMTPTVGVALANGTISLFEELALNKMARKMSKGGFFMKVDPVAHAMKFLIKSFDKWELPFLEVIKIAITNTCDLKSLKLNNANDEADNIIGFARELMYAPYAFVRFMTSFFLHDEAEIVEERAISSVEFEKIQDIGNKLEISQYLVFTLFCKTFELR